MLIFTEVAKLPDPRGRQISVLYTENKALLQLTGPPKDCLILEWNVSLICYLLSTRAQILYDYLLMCKFFFLVQM